MRHTFATLALAAPTPLEWVSKQLRHSSIEITRRYYARWLPAVESRWLAHLDAYAATELDPNQTLDAAGGLG